MESLRTFLPLPISSLSNYYLSCKVVNDLVPKLGKLRVLSLAGYRVVQLPSSIGSLKHLRYLNLSSTEIERLPNSLCKLFNLQTLILSGCHFLIELPKCICNLINLRHLDICGTERLKEMPPQIGNLSNLHTLSKFIVGQSNGLGIRELMKFSHLQGHLRIMGLQNVVNVRDAELVNLKEKQSLNSLALEWIDDFQGFRNEIGEEQVLNSLQSHRNLKWLSIIAYGGTSFPSWVQDCTFTNMVNLQLHNCRKSTSLPSLGKLPLLRILSISGMDSVKEVGVEFHGDGSPSIMAFPSLEILIIWDMLEWEKWSWSNGPNEEALEGFPKLRQISIRNCPKLVGKFPSCLLSLEDLSICNCPHLIELPKMLPSHWRLIVEECQEVVFRSVHDHSPLKILIMKSISSLAFLHDGLIQGLVALEYLEIETCDELAFLWQDGNNLNKLGSLKHLEIKSCQQLVSLVEGEGEFLPCNLEQLSITDCGNLQKLPSGLYSLTSLTQLTIDQCPKLVSFPGGAGWPYALKHLKISNCDSLELLPDGMMTMTVDNNRNQCLLEELGIESCPSLKSFPQGTLPTTLKTLKIRGCENLESLPDTSHSFLEKLGIESCPSLKSFPQGTLPTTLKTLKIRGCENLESLPDTSHSFLEHLEILGLFVTAFPSGEFPVSLKELFIDSCKIQSLKPLHSLSYLSKLMIYQCPELESFPEGGLPIPSLKVFIIPNCENLRSLPHHMDNLTSLQDLSVRYCSCLVSFPERGFPPNLVYLYIFCCKNLAQPMSEWGLHRLASLKAFGIVGTSPSTNMISFPDADGLLLPTSLTSLRISRLNNLKSLSSGLQNLTSLKSLKIGYSPKLQFLPKEGLPATLGYLHIESCPLLRERNFRDYWHIISHIPEVCII